MSWIHCPCLPEKFLNGPQIESPDNMKKITFLLLLCSPLSLLANGKPFTVVFEDGTTYRVNRVESKTEQMDAWKDHPDPLRRVFYAYSYPENIEAYRNLFYKESYPWELEKVFDTWQQQMKSVRFEINGIFYGQMDGQDIACIQFHYTQQAYQIQMSYLFKKMEGTWYPLDAKEMAAHQHVMGLFGTLYPELMASILQPEADSEFKETADVIRNECSAGVDQMTESCLYALAEKWGTAQDPGIRSLESKLFKPRYIDTIDQDRAEQIQTDTRAYLDGLGIPAEGREKVMYYFSKKEGMKAIATIYAYLPDLDRKTLFSDLNRVQQTQQYQFYEYQAQEKPNSN